MRKTLRISALVFIIAIGALGLAIWSATPPKEPTYQGKPLRYWLSAYGWYRPPSATGPQRPTQSVANQAVYSIGTNAIPTMLRMLNERESPLQTKLVQLIRQQRFFKIDRPFQSADEDAWEATTAFEFLGPQATNLLPELVKIYERNPNKRSRQEIVMVATYVAPLAKDTVPLLLRALHDTNDFILRGDAACALGRIHAPAEVAVPELIKALGDSEDMARFLAVGSLATYGHDASAAVPTLVKMLETEKNGSTNSPSMTGTMAWGFCSGDAALIKKNKFSSFSCNVYRAVENALWKIDPNAAEVAGLKQKDSDYIQQWTPPIGPKN